MTKRAKVRAAGAVVLRGEGDDQEVLLIHRQRYDDWSLPKGKGKVDELSPSTAVREVLEETAHHFEPEYLVGIYQWTRPQGDITYLRFAYGGRLRGEELGRRLDEGIVRAVWLTLDEVRACADRHRSPLILQCIEDWRAGQRHPVSLVHHCASA